MQPTPTGRTLARPEVWPELRRLAPRLTRFVRGVVRRCLRHVRAILASDHCDVLHAMTEAPAGFTHPCWAECRCLHVTQSSSLTTEAREFLVEDLLAFTASG